MSEQRYRNHLSPDASGLLQRWSRRKQQRQRGEAERSPEEEAQGHRGEEVAATEPVPVGDRVDPRTGKRIDELTDEDMPPMETLSADSDLSCFWSQGVSEALRTAALRKVFSTPKYNVVDTLCEYAGDYTRYEPLGEVVTHDMQRQIVRLAKREEERARALEAEQTASATAEAGERIAAETDEEPGTMAEHKETGESKKGPQAAPRPEVGPSAAEADRASLPANGAAGRS